MKARQLWTQRLEKMLLESPEGRLPSLRSLAQAHGVSLTTLSGASKELRSRGILEGRRGSGLYLKGAENRSSGLEKLAEALAASLESQDRRSGDKLPSIQSLSRAFHVSHHRLTRAMAHLEKQEVVHRDGRSYRVGPLRKTDRASPRIILVLQSGLHDWTSMSMSSRTGAFALAFHQECLRNHVEQHFLTRSTIRENLSLAALPGVSELAERLTMLGDRCLGVLIIGLKWKNTEIREIHRIGVMAGLRVARFKYGTSTPLPARNSMSKEFGHAEEAGLRMCLSELFKRGHRKVSYLHFASIDWVSERGKHLQSLAPGYGIELVRLDSFEDFLTHVGRATVVDALHRMWGQVPWLRSLLDTWMRVSKTFLGPLTVEKADDLISKFLRIMTSISHLQKEQSYFATSLVPLRAQLLAPMIVWAGQRTSALICANDRLAQYVYVTAGGLGFRFPEDLSAISFDNSPSQQPFPVSSVDFGLGRQGFLAYSHLTGRFRHSPSPGSFPGAYLNHTQSLGQPGRSSLQKFSERIFGYVEPT